MYKRNREKIVSIEEMNKILAYVSKNYLLVEGEKATSNFNRYACYINNQVNFKITYKKGATVCTYTCRKDGDRKLQSIKGQDAFRIVKQYLGHNDKFDLRKSEKFDIWKKLLGWDDKDKKFLASAKPFLYYDEKHENQRLRAYSYDINSSYSNGMQQDMPDTSQEPRINDIIRNSNELGFYMRDNELICTEEIGKRCRFIFPKIKSPFLKFIDVWYKRKKTSLNDTVEKQKAKDVLNFSVGYYQKVNPFIRSRIISFANKIIIDSMDENTIYCNTDSIVSLTQRKDLEFGDDIGQFKQEHNGKYFAYKEFEYQWDLKAPTYRGVAKKWFPKGWDILKDNLPTQGNLVEFNPKLCILEEVNL